MKITQKNQVSRSLFQGELTGEVLTGYVVSYINKNSLVELGIKFRQVHVFVFLFIYSGY